MEDKASSPSKPSARRSAQPLAIMRCHLYAFAFLLLGVPGYADDTEASAALQVARDRWVAAGLRNYSFTIQIGCFLCGQGQYGPVHVIVRSGRVASATYVGDTQPGYRKWHAFKEKKRRLRVTVPMLFSEIESSIAEAASSDPSSYSFRAEYDARDGHPTGLYHGGGFDDDFLHFRVTNFVVR